MPLGRDIAELWEAIPDRIEVSGHAPTWRVTAGSFERALDYAREAYGDVTVLAREDRNRWWPRVTVTLTLDPALAAAAAPLESFRTPEPAPQPAAQPAPDPTPEPAPEPVVETIPAAPEQPEAVIDPPEPSDDAARPVPEQLGADSPLAAIFDHQEELAAQRQRRFPRQRRSRD